MKGVQLPAISPVIKRHFVFGTLEKLHSKSGNDMLEFNDKTRNDRVAMRPSLRDLSLSALLLLLCLSLPAHAQYDYQIISPPGAVSTQTFGINNAGIVTGTAVDDQLMGFRFTYDIESGEYTLFDDGLTSLEISNPGVIVGNVDVDCAILYKNGLITTFSPPSDSGNSTCQARGVNSNGKVSGFLINEDNDEWTGFIYDSNHDSFVEFLPSGQTIPHAINAQGQNIGSVTLDSDEAYPGAPAGIYGFLRQSDGTVQYFAVDQAEPGSTRGRGISESGLIAGYFSITDTFIEAASFVTTLVGDSDFESVTLDVDQILYRKPCDPDLPDPPGPDYELGTRVTASQIRNDGVVVGSCVDFYYRLFPFDFITYDVGFVAIPTD